MNDSGSTSSTSANQQSTVVVRAAPTTASTAQPRTATEAARTETTAAGEEIVVYDFKLHELRHTAASLAIQGQANIKALQNMLGHESAGVDVGRVRPPVRVGC